MVTVTGTVKWFNFSKGYGFIQPDDNSKDIFLHVTALEKANINKIDEGQKISYHVIKEKGKESAVDIILI